MNTLDKFKDFRARRVERLAHRHMIKREIDNAGDRARRDLMMYSSRLM